MFTSINSMDLLRERRKLRSSKTDIGSAVFTPYPVATLGSACNFPMLRWRSLLNNDENEIFYITSCDEVTFIVNDTRATYEIGKEEQYHWTQRAHKQWE